MASDNRAARHSRVLEHSEMCAGSGRASWPSVSRPLICPSGKPWSRLVLKWENITVIAFKVSENQHNVIAQC